MEAKQFVDGSSPTHFIEVYKYKDGTTIKYPNLVHEISTIDICLESTLSESEYLETIAVWRIKLTDVPLAERMINRKVKELSNLGLVVELQTGGYSFNQDLGIINI